MSDKNLSKSEKKILSPTLEGRRNSTKGMTREQLLEDVKRNIAENESIGKSSPTAKGVPFSYCRDLTPSEVESLRKEAKETSEYLDKKQFFKHLASTPKSSPSSTDEPI